MTLARLCLGAAVLVFSADGAAAQDAAPSGPLVRGQLGASINNAGIQNTIEVAWRRAAVSGGVVHAVTPAQMKLGGWVQYSPFLFLDIRAGVDPSAYFGTFNSLQGFDAYEEPFDKEARERRAGAKPGLSVRTYLAPTLKLKAGAFVMASTIEIERWRSSAAAGYFYEPTRDTLLRSSGDHVLNTSSVLMYQRRRSEGLLSVGALHSSMRVFEAAGNRVQKLGAIVVREYDGRRFRLPNPRLTLVVSRYLDDPSKAGQWSGAMAVGFRTGR